MAESLRAFSILIAARDAAGTIERAVASCLDEAECRLVLADDGSHDDTVERARRIAGDRLYVTHVPAPGGVGRARQCALDAVDTPFAAWLDADDAWVPGRAGRLMAMLRGGADVATEAIDLHDGPSGAWLRTLTVPGYLRHGGCVRLFERNHLPGDTQVAFRVAAFRRAGGYDAAIHGPESYDVLLRALRTGARVACGDRAGYRMYAYPGSVSRNTSRQRSALAAVLRKHEYEDIRRLYEEAGYPSRLAAWALVIVAQFRDDPRAALEFLKEASPANADPSIVLEPDGPWPQPEGWRRAFHRGAILLALCRDSEAADALAEAEWIAPTAEGANNMGIALARLGCPDSARACFETALSRFPDYRDARLNLADASPSHITSHPLRRIASRQDYS